MYEEIEKKLARVVKKVDVELAALYVASKRRFNKEKYGSEIVEYSSMKTKDITVHGWLRPDLIYAESIINGRWSYWIDIQASQVVDNKPIPQLTFYSPADSVCADGVRMLEECLDAFSAEGITGYKALELLVDWFLYAVGSKLVEEFPQGISDTVNEFLYKNFKAQYLLLYPADYLIPIATQYYGKGKFNTSSFYPTPNSVAHLMNEIVSNGMDSEKAKYELVNEPCCGSGILLLHASNRSLRLYGMDKDSLMVKICNMNGYLYVPWLVEMSKETAKLLESKSH